MHTPYEWALQQIADHEQPLGANRDDMRMARNTIEIINALGGFTQDQMDKIGENLRNYLTINQPEERVLTPDEAAELKRQKGKPDGKRR